MFFKYFNPNRLKMQFLKIKVQCLVLISIFRATQKHPNMITALTILACLLIVNVLLLVFSVNKIPSEKKTKLTVVAKKNNTGSLQAELKEAV